VSHVQFDPRPPAQINTLSLHDALPISTRAPIPFGAPILWPEMVRRVQPTSASETGSFPNAWTASEWKQTLASRHRAASRATGWTDRKSTRLNSSHLGISYAVFCLKKKK